MNTKEVLIAARELISKPENWTQGAIARDKEGDPVVTTDSTAVCWCSRGAVLKVLFPTSQDVTPTVAQWTAANIALSALHYITQVPVTIFNDSATQEEVLAAFDKAIERIHG